MRRYSLVDQIISRLDKVIIAVASCSSTSSAVSLDSEQTHSSLDTEVVTPLTEAERKHSSVLMRINHSGEVCAQALYLGQALVARDFYMANQLQQAAQEEQTHLRWCKARIQTLGGKTSFLNPLWAMGSFGLGVIAGLVSDKISLSFLAETEQQVSKHLAKHLNEISPNDTISRSILSQMKEDEERHATNAITEGGRPLPSAICFGMSVAAKVMTITARYI